LFFLGINKKISSLLHHNLIFDGHFADHADTIYKHPAWPDEPALYISMSSKNEPEHAPEGGENLVILIPVAPGLDDNEARHNHYLNYALNKLELLTGTSIANNVVYQKSMGIDDFKTRYNAYKGNAYGLANTLRQTAILRPSIRNKNLSNMFYCGQLTVPGPGVPPAIISGEIVANQVKQEFNNRKNQ
jgi:phytoene desaturase